MPTKPYNVTHWIMGIVSSQIETKKMLNIVGQVIIGSRNCCISIERLDKLVAIMKNWQEDLGFGCPNVFKFIKKYLDIENNMFLQNESSLQILIFLENIEV